MLEVHPPHHTPNTWRDFFIHIATIVVGLLIAVALEQTVEAIHHSHQRNELEASLKRDSEENGGYVRADIAIVKKIIAWALDSAMTIERAGPAGPLTLRLQPSGEVFRPNAGLWQTAKTNGAASLLTAGEQNWLEELAQLENTTWVSEGGSLTQLRAADAALEVAITGRAVPTTSGDLDLSSLNPSQRELVVHDLRLIAARSRDLLEGLVYYDIDNRYIFTTPSYRLSDADQLQRFFAMLAESEKANPELRYTFVAR